VSRRFGKQPIATIQQTTITMTEQEAEQQLVDDIKAMLRLNEANNPEPEIQKAARRMLVRVENNQPLIER
jgi:hypothetical protein